MVRSLDAKMQRLQSEFAVERGALVGGRTQDRLLYEHHVSTEMARFHDAAILHETQLQQLRESVALHVADKNRHYEEAAVEVELLTANYTTEMQRLQYDYETQIRDLNQQLLKTKNDLTQSELQRHRRSNMSSGGTFARKKKDLVELSKTGGHAKRLKAAIR